LGPTFLLFIGSHGQEPCVIETVEELVPVLCALGASKRLISYIGQGPISLDDLFLADYLLSFQEKSLLYYIDTTFLSAFKRDIYEAMDNLMGRAPRRGTPERAVWDGHHLCYKLEKLFKDRRVVSESH
jgi:hypothetical protein